MDRGPVLVSLVRNYLIHPGAGPAAQFVTEPHLLLSGAAQGGIAMKKKAVQKLQLSRETIRSLNSGELVEAVGGVSLMTRCLTCSADPSCPVGRSDGCC